MHRLGIVTGTRVEAECLAGPRSDDERPIVCSGADAGRAADLARRLVAGGCTALASVGTAGGLDMTLAAGLAVVADTAVAPSGALWPADAKWRAALTLALHMGGVAYVQGIVAGCDHPVADGAAKRRLFDATGAACCDLESHAVAAAAADAGIPFAAVRVIADTADRGLPLAALAAIGPDGGVRIGRLAGALARRPSEMAEMMRLASASRKALRTLGRVAALAGPLLALP